MRLKKIEVCGFKSFCDKASLSFDHPIVGVVGPNGCGKSNILDAVRWVMGEQSMKSLRGKSRADVIFGGSERRKGSPFAEVSLTVADVAREHRPEGCEESDEIKITRRLSRRGESSYMINGQPSRLRDIRMIFLGTGLGNKQSYALLEQGRVNEFIQSTPEQRRLWVEEAAGISRYKEQRKQAESRLQSTQTNLDRLGDVMKELSSQRNSLQRQARKARKHRDLKSQIQDLDLYLASHRYLENWAKDRQLQLLLGDVQESEITQREQQSSIAYESETLQNELREEAGHLQEERDALQQDHAQVALHKQTLTHLKEDLNSLQDQQSQREQEIERLQSTLETERKDILRLQEEEEQLTEQGDTAEEDLQELQEELQELEERLQEADELIEELKTEVIDAATQEATLRNQLQELQRRQEEMQGRQDRNQQENTEASEQAEKTEEETQKLYEEHKSCKQQREQVLLEREEVITRQQALEQRLRDQQKLTKKLQGELADRRARLSSLRELQSQYQDLNEASRTILQARTRGRWGKSEMPGVVAEFIEPPEQYETAVAAALGDRLQYIVVNHPHVAQEASQYLQRESLGRAGFVLQHPNTTLTPPSVPNHPAVLGPLTDFIPIPLLHQPMLHAMLAPYILVERIEQVMDLWPELMEPQQIFVSLEGELLHPDGTMVAGHSQDASLGILQRKRQIKTLAEEVETLSEEYDDAIDDLEDLEDQLEDLKGKREELLEQAQTLAVRQTEIEKDLQRSEADLERLQERLQLLEHENNRLHTLHAELQAEESNLSKSLASLTQNRAEREARLQESRKQIDQDRQRQGALTQQQTELKVQIASRQQRRESITDQLQQLEGRQRTLGQRQFDLREENESFLQKLSLKQHSQRETKQKLLQLEESIARREALLQAHNQQFAQAEAKLKALQKSLEDTRTHLEKLTEKRTTLLLEQREVEVNLKALDQEIQQRYGISIGEALPRNHCRPSPQASDLKQLHTYKKQLNSLGDVNPLAEQEFEELDERYQFLTKQIDDLEKTIASLKRTIQKINQQTREQFQQTFDVIHKHFAVLFPKLFEGGSAELILTEPKNLLETGVDIMVRPPGKRRQTVALLSGGEKAMTTMALIFSFFLYKPAPFCVLDEVDAPLDDANIDRYNKLLRELSSLSQFVVITHNKRTMEMCDYLYGVTMQEPGASTLVSVQIEEKLADAA